MGRRTGRFSLRAIAIATTIALSPQANAATEIALRFFDDNPAARGDTLSARAHAEIEKAAGATLVARGRDGDGAHRFALVEPLGPAQVRAVLNRLRATGALVYADAAEPPSGFVGKRAPASDAGSVTAIIVKPKVAAKGGYAPSDASRVAAKVGVPVAATRELADGSRVVTFASPLPARAAQAVVAEFAADSNVAHVEVDRRATTQTQPADPLYATQWNLTDPVGGIAAPGAWDVTTGDPNAPVAVLDTGTLPHPDLAGRVIAGYDFIADPNFSNDGDGRDPDPVDPGDFVTQAEGTTLGSPLYGCGVSNSTWHGTMVAGTLGAIVNNGNGVSGVSWSNPILNVRVLGKCGGALSDVADGIRWAAGLPVPGVPANPRPARVINLSMAGSGECGPILQGAVTDAIARGAVIVAAAGNANDEVSNHWPANCNGVIAVAATSKDGSRAFYTNVGTRIALSAPGGGIGGSIPVLRNGGTTMVDASAYGYGQQLGSSLAAPHVAGIASLLLAVDPTMTPAEVQAFLEMGARPFPAVTIDPCSTQICGAGIADAGAAIRHVARNGITLPIVPPPGSGGREPGGSGPVDGEAPAPSPAPSPPVPPPSPAPTPGPSPIAGTPPPARIPVEGGWRAKSPQDLARMLKTAGDPARGASAIGVATKMR